ncbi:TOBE domain protein [Methylobacterium sp. 4-46]|uniref:TOBE domain-containing protein n=1 Tax=unclassified Methylobacterium TaxID=2615210 RepID=UPI000165C76C|nr:MULTISPECIES: molybdopterin-binding protein [Methylobacterium]ACA14985.1 TOBE domain protein [Methylobacterium sp. 4-46]WFT80722.1 molybdopterin-binding protein [Methylobacterium nodulans]
MRISARNQLSGTITSVTKGTTTAHVTLELPGGQVVTAALTNDSVDGLHLAVGKPAVAVIKSGDVTIAVD